MRRVAFVLVALVPGLVWAQGVTLNITFVQGAETQTIGADDCAIDIPIRWTLSSAVLPCTDLEFWLTTGSCGTDPGEHEVISVVSQGSLFSGLTNDSFALSAADLPVNAGADGGTGCGASGIEQTFKVCGRVRHDPTGFCGSDAPTATDNQPATIRYDSVPPDAPTITRVESLDSALSISVSVDDDTTALIVTVTDPAGKVVRVEREVSSGTTIRIGSLTNETTYTVTVVARDDAGNLSPESAPETGTPVLTCGFFCRYKSAGGSEAGCSSGGGALLAFAGVFAGIWLAHARRRRSR
ncbi:MAG TPA: MXAN_2561 family MXYO-CTERM-anchored protein [Myxococcaceae bacterium]|jgi:hypothetical protein|nr:MXAN_2561 family MXYO-CTERM-anchored protein [Myxococcaceae bacterium]